MKGFVPAGQFPFFLIVLVNSGGLILALGTFYLIAEYDLPPAEGVKFLVSQADHDSLQRIALFSDTKIRGLLEASTILTRVLFCLTVFNLVALFIDRFLQRRTRAFEAGQLAVSPHPDEG